MNRPMTEADVLAAAQARISRPSAERDAITALLHWRRTEESTGYSNQEWWDATASLRDAADRLIEVDAYQVTEAASEQIVRDHVEVFDLPGPLLNNRRDEVARRDQEAAWATYAESVLAEHEAGVDAFMSRPEFGGARPVTVTAAQFSVAHQDFRQAWHDADAAGREGFRSREALMAALGSLGIEVTP
jgi:hypothetical protein